jgi:hypothetical protein
MVDNMVELSHDSVDDDDDSMFIRMYEFVCMCGCIYLYMHTCKYVSKYNKIFIKNKHTDIVIIFNNTDIYSYKQTSRLAYIYIFSYMHTLMHTYVTNIYSFDTYRHHKNILFKFIP